MQDGMTNLETTFSGHIHIEDVYRLALSEKPETLLSLLRNPDKRTADNAAWVLTHLPHEKMAILRQYQQELIDEAMETTSITKRRLIMTLLEKQPFNADTIRTDFLDFCLAQIIDVEAPVGIRSLAVKLSYAQCRYYPELLSELKATLELMGQGPLSPGARSIRERVLRELDKAHL